MTITTTDGRHYIVHCLPLHRRRRGRPGVCARPTHWLAMAGYETAVANTRREALQRLRILVENTP